MSAGEPILVLVPEPAVKEDPAARALRTALSFHQTLLVVSLLVLSLAALLKVQGQTQVALPLLGIPLPELCYWRRFLGIDCPGCGLTRCFISLAHGDLPAAWHFHPVGMLIFAGVLFQVPYRVAQLWRLRRGCNELNLPGWHYLVWLAALLMVGQWMLRNIL